MTLDPVFRHRENHCHALEGVGVIWHSRSVAVVGTVVARVAGAAYVALVERGPALPDEVGKLCLPCGYLDWDETVFDAARREVFEETGLDVASWRSSREPWRLSDDPLGKQNVSLHYWFFSAPESLPELTFEHGGAGEIARTVWMPLEEAEGRELAFGHQHVVRAFRERLLAALAGG